MKKTLVKTDRNGTKYWEVSRKCEKCGGTGTYRWGACINDHYQFSGVCFDCDGTGIEVDIEKEYTEAHAQKLADQRAKRQEKKLAEAAEARAKRQAEEEERARKQAEREARWAEERAASEYIGSIGDKLDIEVTFSHEVSFDTQFGRMYIYFFKDEAGNTLAWKTSASLCLDNLDEHNRYVFVNKGEKIRFTATIKEHSEYKGEKQTMLQRVRKIQMIQKAQEV